MLDAFKKLQNYSWPGNVRELENGLERFSALAADCNPTLDSYTQLLDECFIIRPHTKHVVSSGHINRKRKRVDTDDIIRMIHEMDGNKATAAKKMGISRMTLYRKIKKHNEQIGRA